MVADILADEAERRGLLSDGQFGSRKRQLAIGAAAIMVEKAHAAWTEGSRAGVLQMDIKTAFPSVWRGRLVHIITGKGIVRDHIRWTADFPSNRTIEMVIIGDIMETRPVEAGIPPGSPVSQILFTICTSGLMESV